MSNSGGSFGLVCWNCGEVASRDAVVCGGCGTVFAPVAPRFSPGNSTAVDGPLSEVSEFTVRRAPAAASAEMNAVPMPDRPPKEAATFDPSTNTNPRVGASQLTSSSIDRRWSTRVQRGWKLSEHSIRIVMSSPGLIALPVLSSTAVLVGLIIAVLIGSHLPSVVAFIWWCAAGVALATVVVGGQAVITHRVGAILRGESTTNGESLRAVLPCAKELAKWAAVSLTVGVLVRTMERGGGPIGWVLRLFAAGVAIAWSALTFFVIPVMVFEGLSARDAFTRSREVVRTNWGEGVVGVGILNALFMLVNLAVIVLCILLISAHAYVLTLLVFVLALAGLNLLAAVASPVFSVVLYNFAISRELAPGFSAEDMSAVFRPRRRRVFAAVSGAAR